MIIKTNAQGKERKRMALVISQWTGHPVKYAGAPTFNYEVGGIVIDKDASIDLCRTLPDEATERLMQHLINEGFGIEDFTSDAETVEEEDASEVVIVEVSLPRTLFTDEALANLHGILTAKKTLICKALGCTDLPVKETEDKVSFPWFDGTLNPEELDAYEHFICKLCEMARTQKRVVAKEKKADNDKYAFRCFLLRLGFIGDEYKTRRKILLRNLTGSTAFKNGTKEVE